MKGGRRGLLVIVITAFLSYYGIWLEHGYGLGIQWVLTSASSLVTIGISFCSSVCLFPVKDSLSCWQEKQRRIRKCFRILPQLPRSSGSVISLTTLWPSKSEKGHFYYLQHFPAPLSLYSNLQPPAIPPIGTRTGPVCPHLGPPPQRISEASVIGLFLAIYLFYIFLFCLTSFVSQWNTRIILP